MRLLSLWHSQSAGGGRRRTGSSQVFDRVDGLGFAGGLSGAQPVAVSAQKKTLWQIFKSFFDPVRQPVVAPAVCIPPGAHLILKDIPADIQRQCRVGEEEGVVFVQLSADINCYRDAVRFNNGFQMRLQDLREGMRVEVLSLAGVAEYTPVMFEALR